MVHETKERSNSHMERPRQSIFEEIQIHVENSPGPNDPPMHEEKTRGKLQRMQSEETLHSHPYKGHLHHK